MDNKILDEVSSHKHLGVLITQNLSLNSHIDSIVKQHSKRLDLMGKLKYKIDRKSLETIYFSFIRPCIEYGDVLYTHANNYMLMKLDKIQYIAMLNVTGARHRTPSHKLFDELEWVSLSKRRNIHMMCLLYKIVNGDAPVYLSNILHDICLPDHAYGLRGQNGNNFFRLPLFRSACLRNDFFVKSIELWNNLSETTKNLDSLSKFKSSFIDKRDKIKQRLYTFGNRKENIIHCQLILN